MDKLTLTRKEAAEILGISTATVTQWVVGGRLKAYRVSDKPRSPYLFTREDCHAALKAVPVETVCVKGREVKTIHKETLLSRHKAASKELKELLKDRGKGRMVE